MTGILFDLDGTLLDTLEDLLDATNYALACHGYPKRTLEQLRRAVGGGAENQIRRSLPQDAPPEAVGQVLSTYKPYYTTHCQIKTRPYDGIPQALEALKGRFPMAIVSNKPDPAVKALSGRMFPGLYALGEIPGCPRKPDPAMLRMAMEAIGVDRCIYVGDSEVDVITAKNAGCPCLSVLWGFRDRTDMEAVGGTHFCQTPGDLVPMLEALARTLEDAHGQ